jgi:CrcB protein
MPAQLPWIALGGALGALARHGVSAWTLARLGPHFPFGTVTVNVTGSFLIGIVGTLLPAGAGLPAATRPFFIVGFLGAYTTFSTYAFDTWALWDRSSAAAVTNVVLSNVLALVAVVAGTALARSILE